MTRTGGGMAESCWWGDFVVPKNSALRWQIGPTTLWIHRTAGDWRISSLSTNDPTDSRLAIAEPVHEPSAEDAVVSRYAVRDDNDTVRLVPVHADRPVIVKSETPFFLPPGEEATLYIGTPLWVRILAGRRLVELTELPLFRPSDTWFGPNTLTGTLCYGSRTTARMNLENLPLRPHRAVAAARIQNRAKSRLLLEKLKLPVEHLSLFTAEGRHLWTEALTLVREHDTEHATVRLEKRPTRAIGETTLVAAPREKLSKGFLIDAFGGIFAKKTESKDERVSRTPPPPGGTDSGASV